MLIMGFELFSFTTEFPFNLTKPSACKVASVLPQEHFKVALSTTINTFELYANFEENQG